MTLLLATLNMGGPLNVIFWLVAVAIAVYIIYYAVSQTSLPEPIRLPVMGLILILIIVVVLKVLGVI
jgi:uncharacterized membrane protein (UPF0182 family)